MGENVSSRGSHRVSEEGLGVGLDLVGDDDCEVEGLGYSEEFVEVAVEALLTFGEAFAADVFTSEMT